MDPSRPPPAFLAHLAELSDKELERIRSMEQQLGLTLMVMKQKDES